MSCHVGMNSQDGVDFFAMLLIQKLYNKQKEYIDTHLLFYITYKQVDIYYTFTSGWKHSVYSPKLKGDNTTQSFKKAIYSKADSRIILFV